MFGNKNPGIIGTIVSVLTFSGHQSSRRYRPGPTAAPVLQSRDVLARKETYFAQMRYTWWKQ